MGGKLEAVAATENLQIEEKIGKVQQFTECYISLAGLVTFLACELDVIFIMLYTGSWHTEGSNSALNHSELHTPFTYSTNLVNFRGYRNLKV